MSSGTEAIDRKQRIRDRYRGVDTSELEVIPAKIVEGLGESTSIRRVAAYVRVSTDNDEQTSSYELQKNYYTDYIKAQPGWEFVGIYDDEGISGTSLAHRKGMQQLIEDCKAGKIDLILTKSIARFAVVPQIKRNSILHIIRDCFCDVSMNNSRLFDADSALYFI